MWGYPYTSAAGASHDAGVLITTAFTREFRMTLIYGVPFIAMLTFAYYLWYRRRRVASGVASFDVIERDA